MAEFLQTRGAYDGPTLRKSVRGEDSIDAMPVRLESMYYQVVIYNYPPFLPTITSSHYSL